MNYCLITLTWIHIILLVVSQRYSKKNKCSVEEFMCQTNPMKCIMKKSLCNYISDCADGSDESPEACEAINQPSFVKCNDATHFQCKNKQLCISRIYFCDGKFDCEDRSDETDCSNSQNLPIVTKSQHISMNNTICRSDEFYCGIDSTTPCISIDWRCDGSYDCQGTEKDEENCKTFKCYSDKPNKCKTIDECYEDEKRCDGFSNCADNSDEESCNKSTKVTCDPLKEFKCTKNNTCISYEKVCDQVNDCEDGSDERPGGSQANCQKTPCKVNNGNCEQICVSLYSTRKCLCKPGYKIDPSNDTRCIDIDECADGLVCSQKCTNFPGSYKCECLEGFQMSSYNEQLCLAVGEKFLLYTTKNSIRQLQLLHRNMDMLYSHTDKNSTFLPIGIDFDYTSKNIFWSQSEPRPEIFQIHHSFSKAEQMKQISLVKSRIHLPVGLAYDWIHGLLFWADVHFNEISVLNITNGMRRKLVQLHNDSKVFSIVVHPKFRRIYWTDWSKEPKIESVGMDGEDRKTIIEDRLITPNGLAIDYYFDDLYWVDAKARNINAYNLKTFKRREIVNHLTANGFDIDVFEDWLYLSDGHHERIIKIHKKTGEQKFLVSSPKPMGVKLFHQLAQPKNFENVCFNNPCQYLCLPSALNLENHIKFRCACPDFSNLLSDERNCSTLLPKSFSEISYISKSIISPQKSKVNVYLIMGVVAIIVIIMLLVAVLFGITMYRNYIRRVIKRATNFNNPTYYHKTSNPEIQLFNKDPLLPDVYDKHSGELLFRNQLDDGL